MHNLIQRLRCRIFGHGEQHCQFTIIGRIVEHTDFCSRCRTSYGTSITNINTPKMVMPNNPGMDERAQRDYMN